ncbi:MAG: glycoside hydrolase family 15 protein [Dehalococcoidia bacterium]
MTPRYKNLEDYGIIGNLETCALVGNDGSIDWLCFPYLESASVFAAILDDARGGSFRIGPPGNYSATQAYVDRTNVLQTTFNVSTGTAVLTDFMPVKGEVEGTAVRAVYRKLECVRGAIEIAVEFVPRPDYARAAVAIQGAGSTYSTTWGEEQLTLISPIPLVRGGDHATGTALLKKGETLWFMVQYGPPVALPAPDDCEAFLEAVEGYWFGWTEACTLCETVDDPRWSEILIRSGHALKLLTVPESGAIAAAATTSLPESIGGARNWDYRFAWVRDASFTTQALFHLGHADDAASFRRWMKDRGVQAGAAANLRVLYSLRGEADTTEIVLQNLAGYRNSAPVRIGNGAAGQRQLDIYGEAVQAIYDTTRYGEEVTPENWPAFRALVDYVCQVWDTEDSGIWEVRGGPRHYVYSKLMCWVALDRGIKIAQAYQRDAPLDQWHSVRDEIRQAILDRGFSTKLNSFVQSFDSEALDAASLLIPQMEFLPASDPRVQGTIDATLKQLATPDGLVYRYRSEDGLPGQEGAFILCSFWLVTTLALAGRVEEAEKILSSVTRYLSPLGLMAEEVDPATGKQIGNFPQAFSHQGLVNSLLYLSIAKGKPHAGPKPVGAG